MKKGFANIMPVYHKETTSSSRTAHLTVIVMAFNLVLALVGCLQLELMVKNSVRYGGMAYSSLLELYTLVAAMEAAFLLFIVPALTAGSISGERERQTLDLLLCTRLRPVDIIVGKLLSSLSTVLVLLMSSLPVLALVYIYGGIGLRDLAVLFVCLACCAFYTGSASLFFSARMKRTTAATVLSYLWVIFCVVGTYLLLLLVFNIYQLVSAGWIYDHPDVVGIWDKLLLLNPAVLFYSLFSQQIGGLESVSFLGWYDMLYILNDEILTPGWIVASCLVQVILAVLALWLAARAICPQRRGLHPRSGM